MIPRIKFPRTPAILLLAALTATVLISSQAFTTAIRIVNPHPELNLGLTPDPEKGYQILLNTPMAAPVMREDDPQNLWQVWEPELRQAAQNASPEQRRKMTFERYGWAQRLEPGQTLPLGYLPDGHGSLVTNCFACHGGKLAGKTIPGMGNTHLDLTTLATDVARLRALQSGGDPQAIQDVKAPFNTPLNHHRGGTNAVIFAHVFAGLRDPIVGMEYARNPEKLLHHDVNPPAWWNVRKKERLYFDAFAPKTPRQLMPFAMSPLHSQEQFQSFEPNFIHIRAYIENLQPPKYPYPINQQLAQKGKILFEQKCADCHGTYGQNWTYPNKIIPIERIGTDPRRLHAVPEDRRNAANNSWLQYEGQYPLHTQSQGYLAPPLDGIWATAPYLHNGSIPTLHHLFNVDERPTIWKRTETGYDTTRVGLEIHELDTIPEGLNTRQRRMYYDTRQLGSSNTGHTFPDDELNTDEKQAVLEYLKTL